MIITFDTGILVRANTKAVGLARHLLLTVEATGALLIVSQYILDEVERVLQYPRMQAAYGLSHRQIRAHLDYILSMGKLVNPYEGRTIIPDDACDDPVVYTALAGEAEILCTVDKHFYHPDVLTFCSRYRLRVMRDAELLDLLRRRVI